MTMLQTKLPLDTWIAADWADFVQWADAPECERLKGYYYQGEMRWEAMSTGSDHSSDHHFLIFVISLYAMLRQIPIRGKDACSYRRTGIAECQPDISYYVGNQVDAVPWGTRVVDLEEYPVPDLVIEISDTSLSDDRGQKRLQYEDLGIPEYWILNVQEPGILAFAITPDGGSHRIRVSQVLPGLSLDLVEEALRRSREMDQSAIGAWLMNELH